MTKTASFSLAGYQDTVMGSIAFGEIGCVLASGPAPTTPEDWRAAFDRYGHTNNPEATYTHAIAAGLLVPKGDELHLAPNAEEHFEKFKKLRAA